MCVFVRREVLPLDISGISAILLVSVPLSAFCVGLVGVFSVSYQFTPPISHSQVSIGHF